MALETTRVLDWDHYLSTTPPARISRLRSLPLAFLASLSLRGIFPAASMARDTATAFAPPTIGPGSSQPASNLHSMTTGALLSRLPLSAHNPTAASLVFSAPTSRLPPSAMTGTPGGSSVSVSALLESANWGQPRSLRLHNVALSTRALRGFLERHRACLKRLNIGTAQLDDGADRAWRTFLPTVNGIVRGGSLEEV